MLNNYVMKEPFKNHFLIVVQVQFSAISVGSKDNCGTAKLTDVVNSQLLLKVKVTQVRCKSIF